MWGGDELEEQGFGLPTVGSYFSPYYQPSAVNLPIGGADGSPSKYLCLSDHRWKYSENLVKYQNTAGKYGGNPVEISILGSAVPEAGGCW